MPHSTIKITIFGQPVVKKNNQKVGINRRTGRPVKYNTKAYEAWLQTARLQVPWAGRPPIDEPVNLCCRFYMKDRRRVDLSNLYEGIQDLLVDRGVLKDDSYTEVTGHDGSGVEVDPKNPRMVIVITPRLAERPDAELLDKPEHR
jgi:Holliday junction resolvase RusA-like endonuclease